MIDYKEYNDYELVSLAQEKNEDAIDIIYAKYKPMIYKKCQKYINILKGKGIELCDLIQECYIILDYSIKNFNEKKDNSFYTFFNVCLNRHLVDQYRKSITGKNKILNESLSLESSLEEDNDGLINAIEDSTNNPVQELINSEEYLDLYNKIIDKLTSLEECVFILKLHNFNYKEIATILDKDNKSIDNAIQRIKIKINHLTSN